LSNPSGKTLGTPSTAVLTIVSEDVYVPQRPMFDFDGDGKSDLAVFRPMADPAVFDFAIRRSSDNSLLGYSWGLPGDKLAPGDYDGDGKTDPAVYRESENRFYILQTGSLSVRIDDFGIAGDILTVGDWDGDGKDDVAVYRAGAQSIFFYRGSLNNPNGDITYLPWGTTGDVPMRGDFDGDGKQDAAVFRPANATWYIRQSSDGLLRTDNWGLSTDKFVPADYDGDGRTDLAVFRPSNGTWYIKQSITNQPRYENFGLASDTLVPADYDGDGRTDIAVYRNGIWYLLQSTSGFAGRTFGTGGDTPVPNAYVNP
ncbi:MAG: VCBS repeat-containing protein, partial [Pyrinomonadaceae bacterium]